MIYISYYNLIVVFLTLTHILIMTTIKEHCCGADLFFNKKMALRELRTFRKKGATGATSKIIQQLENTDPAGKYLVDIGGGIGAIQWWFLGKGGAKSTDIDASSGYLKQAEDFAIEQGWQSQTDFLMGDCLELYPQIENPDYVTLDKVICCYPDYKDILEATCDKSNAYVSLSYPIDGRIAQLVRGILRLFLKIIRNPFSPYIHSVKDIRAVFETKGYQRLAHEVVFPWHVETYLKNY